MRRIRLTEGQLHNVIRESVSQILNELDWKTYDNAAKKRIRQMQNPDDIDEYSRDVYPVDHASVHAAFQKYPHLQSAIDHRHFNEPLTPEEREEYDAFDKEQQNQLNGRYRYEKGGRGYYLDDEE